MAEKPIGPGTVLAGRFRLEDLLQENGAAKFWRASDLTLARSVAVHVVEADDARAETLLAAARTSATVTDGHILRVLDAAQEHGVAYVVNEWGSGMSLDRMLAEGPLSPRRAAWVVKEVADALGTAHRNGVAHGRLVPENVMVSEAGAVKLIGFVVDGALNGRRDGSRGFGDQSSDVTNLAALLYAGLVAKWPGTESSTVPPAPQEHGHPLRPRQVRAGIPRPLDAICDRVLNPDQAHRHVVPIETAQEVAAALSDFIGDVSAAGPVEYEHTMVLTPPLRAEGSAGATQTMSPGMSGRPPGPSPTTTTDLPAMPDEEYEEPAPADEAPEAAPAQEAPAPDADPDAAPESDPDADPEAGPDPEATQAGTPVFFDEGSGVGWLSPAESRGLGSGEPRRPPPPPPLPEPEPKPLFAPDPPEGRPPRGWPDAEPTRRGPTHREDPHQEQRYPSAAGPGTGSLPPVWGPDADQPPPDDDSDWGAEKAGRGWLRLGSIIVGCLVLVFAVFIAFNLGRGSHPSATTTPKPSPSQQPTSTAGQVLPIVGVRDFDPEADPPEENPQLAPLAVDGDPSTAWETVTYLGNPQLGGLKDGVGLMVDLGKQQRVSQVSVTLQGRPTSLQILSAGSSDTAPTSLSGLTKVAAVTGAGTHVDLRLKHPAMTEYLVVWLTSLPPYHGGYRGRIAEIQVHS